MPIKRIFWIVLAFTLIVWIGVGIYFKILKKPAGIRKTVPQPSSLIEQEFVPWTTAYSPDEPMWTVEGIYTGLRIGSQFTLDSNGQTMIFSLPKDIDQFYMPGTNYKLRIYYQEKDGRLVFVSGEKL